MRSFKICLYSCRHKNFYVPNHMNKEKEQTNFETGHFLRATLCLPRKFRINKFQCNNFHKFQQIFETHIFHFLSHHHLNYSHFQHNTTPYPSIQLLPNSLCLPHPHTVGGLHPNTHGSTHRYLQAHDLHAQVDWRAVHGPLDVLPCVISTLPTRLLDMVKMSRLSVLGLAQALLLLCFNILSVLSLN